MKRLEKQLPSKASFSPILQLNCSNLCYISVKDLRVTKIVKEIKFEGAWGELECKKMFPEAIIDKIFEKSSGCEIAHCGKSLFSVFQEFFASIDKTFTFAGRLGAGLSFYAA